MSSNDVFVLTEFSYLVVNKTFPFFFAVVVVEPMQSYCTMQNGTIRQTKIYVRKSFAL